MILIYEFEGYLRQHYGGFQKEVVYSSIMPTTRKFRADYYLPNDKIIIEINGGVWKDGGGRHNRGKGYEEDLIKANLAQKFGFEYYQFTYRHLKELVYKDYI